MSNLASLRMKIKQTVDGELVQKLIIILIVINAVSLGLETWSVVYDRFHTTFFWVNTTAVVIFVIEITARLIGVGPRFFRDPWNLFDVAVIGISIISGGGAYSAARALRIVRVFRLLSVVPGMRHVLGSLVKALPAIGSIAILLILVMYVWAVMTTHLYRDAFPEMFGSIGQSMLTLFQLMTLEGWASEIVRPVAKHDIWAWPLLISFMLISAIAILNLVVAALVDAMAMHQHGRSQGPSSSDDPGHSISMLTEEVAKLRKEILDMRDTLKKNISNEG